MKEINYTEPSITLPWWLIQKYGKTHGVFIETGSFYGGAAYMASMSGFTDVHTIEIDPELFLYCEKRFKDARSVDVINGDSIGSLKLLMEVYKGTNSKIMFWLDAHVGNSPTSGKLRYPLLRELEIICDFSPFEAPTILIDDIQYMLNGSWPELPFVEVMKRLLMINPRYNINFVDSNALTNGILRAETAGSEVING